MNYTLIGNDDHPFKTSDSIRDILDFVRGNQWIVNPRVVYHYRDSYSGELNNVVIPYAR